jgi:hypothetical protein
MDALYERGDCFFIRGFRDKNCAFASHGSFTYDDVFSVGIFIESANSVGWAVATSVGVFEPEIAGRTGKRGGPRTIAVACRRSGVKNGNAKEWEVQPFDDVSEAVKRALDSLDAADPARELPRSGLH